jgi:beta-glucosidase
MVQAIYQLNEFAWCSLEDSLTPLPENSEESSVLHHLPAVILLPLACITGCFALVNKVVEFALSFFQPEIDPEENFEAVLEDSRLWSRLGHLEEATFLGQGDPHFLFGTATCTWQDSGAENCPDSQWTSWERTCLPEGNRSGKSANLFQLYQTFEGREQIIERLHRLGVNSYRFSVEWSQIEPSAGAYQNDALEIYVALCKHLRDEGIAPMVTLHHFSEPGWFHERGSFENEANIPCFLTFAEIVFQRLTQNYKDRMLVEHFCTINEPAIEAFSRYIRGAFSPGVVLDWNRAGNFLFGAFQAHTAVRNRLKHLQPTAQIGIVHQQLEFIPGNPLLVPTTRYLNRLLNEVAMKFFRTGTFELKIPFSCHILKRTGRPETDFVGLQCYVRPVLGLTGSTSFHEPMTEMPFREDPESLYAAIVSTHEAYQAPIIVTENGISTHDETQRERYLKRALYSASRAQEVIGKDNLKGYFLWSFCKNAEWDMGMNPQEFGAYGLHHGNLNAHPKPGVVPFIRIAQAWKRSLPLEESA